MPYFNEFRMNELLLGKIIVAKKTSNFGNNSEDDEEVKQFLSELEEQKRESSKKIVIRVMEKITGKKLVSFKNNIGQKSIREYDPSLTRIKPEIRLSHTIQPSISFDDNINEWRTYIHDENIRSEEEWILKGIREEERKQLVDVYSETILNKMMKIY